MANSNLCINSSILKKCAETDIKDTRYKLNNPDLTVVRITSTDYPDLGGGWGSGIVIGPNKVLTAAHVVAPTAIYNRGIIYTGEHRGSTRSAYTISSIKTHPGYKGARDPDRFDHDLAVITTKENFWAYRPFMEAPDPLYLTEVIWTGYPADLIEKQNEISQWETKQTIFQEDERFLTLHSCVKSFNAQSGSGLRVVNEGGPRVFSNGEVIGVLVGGCGPVDTVFTLLRGGNYEFVKREVFGETFSEYKIYDGDHQNFDCDCHQHYKKVNPLEL